MYSLDSLPWGNSFSKLGEAFYSRVTPTPFQSPARLLHFNDGAAALLGLVPEAQAAPALLQWLSGQALPDGAEPLAMLYAGHQFGHFVPQLGDGRAIMLGEISHEDGSRWELQLKGSGQTPYSRDGDGRAVLRSSIREYLCSEAMHGLGIPTTRALALIGSTDEIYRERIEPGAMLTRLAPSHVRFGSFEVFYYRSQFEHIKTLADYVIAHHYPALQQEANPYLALLQAVTERTAALIAQWQAVGFAHGVMNSDNMSILGLTLDYGPFGFMEAYDPNYICNHSDHSGRYAFDQQAEIGLFNMSCLAQALLPLLHEVPEQGVEMAKDVLGQYQGRFVDHYAALMRAKLGLQDERAEDQSLLQDLLDLMAANQVDYTILFRQLADFETGVVRRTLPTCHVRDLFLDASTVPGIHASHGISASMHVSFDAWAKRYAERLLAEQSDDAARKVRMNQVNPKYILRNYLAEVAIRKAEDAQDYSEIDILYQLLQQPFDEHPEYEAYAGHPPEWATKIAVSCSS